MYICDVFLLNYDVRILYIGFFWRAKLTYSYRMQMKPLLQSLVGAVRQNLHELLLKPITATGFPRHFGLTCDKSTPMRTTNHALMILIIVDGRRYAVPIGSPAVYSSNDGTVTGGSSKELGNQLINTLLEFTKIPDEGLKYHAGNAMHVILF